MRLKLCQVQGAQNFVFPLWGTHFQSVGGQDFWSKLAFRGEWKPRNSWFSKNGTGQYCAPLFAIFVEELEEKTIYFAPKFEFLGDFRSEEPLFQKNYLRRKNLFDRSLRRPIVCKNCVFLT